MYMYMGVYSLAETAYHTFPHSHAKSHTPAPNQNQIQYRNAKKEEKERKKDKCTTEKGEKAEKGDSSGVVE